MSQGGGDLDNAAGIQGGTDGTIIGNIADRMKVTLPTGSLGATLSYTSKLRYRYMNAGSGGIARGTDVVGNSTWVQVYSRAGSGVITGFGLNLGTANSKWYVRLEIDGAEEVFGSDGILTDDINTVYGLIIGTQNNGSQGLNLSIDASYFFFSSPLFTPLAYTTGIKVFVKRNTGEITKKFFGGLIGLTEET